MSVIYDGRDAHGYARVSTHKQNPGLQQDALERAGCDQIFTDKASGAQDDRTGLSEALETTQEGDTLAVWRLDRLGRSLIDVMSDIEARGTASFAAEVRRLSIVTKA